MRKGSNEPFKSRVGAFAPFNGFAVSVHSHLLSTETSTLNGTAACLWLRHTIICAKTHQVRRELARTLIRSLKQLHDVLAVDKVLFCCRFQLFPERLDFTTNRNDLLTNRIAALVIETTTIKDRSHF